MLNIIRRLSRDSDVLHKSVYVFLLRVLAAAITLVLSIVITRELGPQISGYYFFSVSFVLFLSSISSLGLANASLKLVSINKENTSYLVMHIKKVIALVIFASLFVYLTLSGYQFLEHAEVFQNEMISKSIKVVFLVLPFFSLMLIFSSVFQALDKLTSSMFLLGMGYQTIMLATLFFLNVKSLNELFTAYVVSIQLVTIICLIYFCIKRKNSSGNKFKFNRSLYAELLTLSLPMMVSQIVSQISNFCGHFLLSIFSTPENVAYISVCLRISIVMSFFIIAVNRVVAPRFASSFQAGDIKQIKNLIATSNKLLLVFSLPVFTVVVIYGKELLSFFGSEFVQAYSALIIISAGQLIASLTGTVVLLLQMTGYQNVVARNVIFSSVISIIIGLFLVPKYGLIGAAIMTFISLSTINLLCYWSVFRLLGFNPAKV